MSLLQEAEQIAQIERDVAGLAQLMREMDTLVSQQSFETIESMIHQSTTEVSHATVDLQEVQPWYQSYYPYAATVAVMLYVLL